ncbi:mRNA interferase MazF [Promicromonospora umidemergens]|uniref:mRNA interferase MazF n=1 Tax=Promicromonospora umidemergens TaxID=629679 RepID=A0ABP8XH22_9MICO|nr:type II toxin-antitoxin system PemK/MazF family toxin [Promicromonospora umidemergens]MCP2282791.1 mRNA interferase MazF [Promicromonospora umidemergens]
MRHRAELNDIYWGDRLWVSKDPVGELEQAGDRAWLVLSHPEQHQAMELVIAVPLTSVDRGWRTHVRMNTDIDGAPEVAMCEQVRSMPVQFVRGVDSAPYSDRLVEQIHTVLKTLTAPRRSAMPDRGI